MNPQDIAYIFAVIFLALITLIALGQRRTIHSLQNPIRIQDMKGYLFIILKIKPDKLLVKGTVFSDPPAYFDSTDGNCYNEPVKDGRRLVRVVHEQGPKLWVRKDFAITGELTENCLIRATDIGKETPSFDVCDQEKDCVWQQNIQQYMPLYADFGYQ